MQRNQYFGKNSILNVKNNMTKYKKLPADLSLRAVSRKAGAVTQIRTGDLILTNYVGKFAVMVDISMHNGIFA